MTLKKTLFYFFTWRIVLFVFLALALSTLTLQQNFLGWGLTNYLRSPQIWSWANFDGEHYLLIAQFGYSQYLYFFFPIYPLLIRILTVFFSDNSLRFITPALIISNLSFVIALLGFVKLMEIDYSVKIVKITVTLLLLFPTSFFFASAYTESLFFALVVWSIYFARNKSWIFAGFLGAVASATRIIGVTILPVLVIELLYQRKDKDFNLLVSIISVSLTTLGLVAYMYFLNNMTSDPLAFFTQQQGVFGQQRSVTLVLLPQVFYRYIFKILPAINYNYLPGVYSTYLEFVVALLFLPISLLSFFKLRLSYALYLFLGFMIPTLTGSFYSMPRFVIVLFPAFIFLALLLSKIPRTFKLAVYVLLFILLGISTALFVRGYFIA